MIVDTAYGRMIVNRHDVIQTFSLVTQGVSPEHQEIQLLTQAIQQRTDQPNFIDVGANFGTFSLALAPALPPGGKVYAFEPQRIIFNMLAGSVALNSYENLHCYNIALGNRDDDVEIPQFDYHRKMNFGSVEFGGEQKEKLDQERQNDPTRREIVPLRRLDSFAFEHVGLIKIDVEGMEELVLDGAAETIARCRPMVFLEVLKSDADTLRQRFSALGYEVISMGANDFYYPREIAL